MCCSPRFRRPRTPCGIRCSPSSGPSPGCSWAVGPTRTTSRRQLEVLAEHPDPWVRAARYSFSALLELQATRIPDVAERTAADRLREVPRARRTPGAAVHAHLAESSSRWPRASSRSRSAGRRRRTATRSTDSTQSSGSMLLIKLGQAHACAGEVEHGRRLIEQGARTAEHCGEFADAAMGHAELAVLAFKLDDRAEARRQLAMPRSSLSEARADREAGRHGLRANSITSRDAVIWPRSTATSRSPATTTWTPWTSCARAPSSASWPASTR
jgi:hypothetical protein